MGDLKDPRLMYLKGFLFLVVGILAVTLILIESPTIQTALLLAIAVWAFCRLYYFMFYVIEHYVDGRYKFAGVISFLLYLFRRRNKDDGRR